MKNILNKNEIKLLKISGRILKEALQEVSSRVKPGITTLELDEIAEKEIRKRGGEPAFKGYEAPGTVSFPASLCVSVNDEVVHGIPSDRIIKDGDIVSLDLGVRYKGIYSDMATTVVVGKTSEKAQRLVDVTKKCLEIGIEQAIAGNRIGDIGNAVQIYAEKCGFGVVRDLVGHGIGTEAHMQPHIPNFGKKGKGPLIEEGMALAIEPMITEGGYNIKLGDDGWTISTSDGKLSAHFEHTIVIEGGRPVIVTI